MGVRAVVSSLVAAGLLLAVSMGGLSPRPAEAGVASVKFFVTEYRLKVNPAASGKASSHPLVVMEIRGRASIHGSDKIEFRWEVPDAGPYLELLAACGTGRLNGFAALTDQGGTSKLIEGSGPLIELSCRMILK